MSVSDSAGGDSTRRVHAGSWHRILHVQLPEGVSSTWEHPCSTGDPSRQRLRNFLLTPHSPLPGPPDCLSNQKCSDAKDALQVDAVQRLMAALTSRGQGASRPREALALLNHALGSERLLVEGRLQEYCACLSAVLSGCPSLQPDLASSLLMCFNMAGLCAAMMQATPTSVGQLDLCHIKPVICLQHAVSGILNAIARVLESSAKAVELQVPLHVPTVVGICLSCCDNLQRGCSHSQAILHGSRSSTGPSETARLLLDFSLETFAVPGGTAAAVQLLQGIAAAGGLAAYLNACLAVVLAAECAEAKAEGMAWLTSLQLDTVPLPSLTEAIVQVCRNTTTSVFCTAPEKVPLKRDLLC